MVCDCLFTDGEGGGEVLSVSIGIGRDWARVGRIAGFIGIETEACRDEFPLPSRAKKVKMKFA